MPEAITRAALRKLWLSDPVLANLDRLNDYDDDYSFVDTVISAVQTSYKVGKGHVDEAEEALAKLDPSDADKELEAKKEQERAGAPADSAAVDGEASNEPLSNNDAAGDESDAAPRQVGADAPNQVAGGLMDDKDI